MELHVNQCNKSGCMGVYFLREQFRFCFDITVNLCKGGYGYTTRQRRLWKINQVIMGMCG